MSSASTPSAASSPAPKPLGQPPQIVRVVPRKPRHRGAWTLAVLILLSIGAYLYWKARTDSASAGRNSGVVIRTVAVIAGEVQRTVRVTGAVQAEKFSSILAPQIRGSRSDRYRNFSGGGGGGGSTPAATPSSISSNTSTSGSSTAGSGFTGATPGSTDATTTATASGSSIGATRGTTNRFSDMSGSSTKSNSDVSRATASASAVGQSSLGSTAANLVGTGSGGGGGGGGGGGDRSDFMMVLLKCVPGGTHVKAGDPVAEFDRQYQTNRLDDYKASVAQHEANIKKLKADQAVAKQAHDQLVESAKADWDKAKLDLQTISVRSAIEGEDFKLAEQEAAAHYKQISSEAQAFAESQRADLRRSELDRDQSKIELQRAQNTVDRMVMKAPINGIVVMQTIFRGGEFGQVREGDQIYSGQVFMTIVDPSRMVLNATVNQVDSELLRVGMKASVHLDAYPDLTLAATVIGVGAMTNGGGWRAAWVREVPVRLQLNEADARVIPDLSGSADIELAAEKPAAVASLAGVFQDTPDGRPYVFVEGPAGFEKRQIELGLTSNVAAAVRSGLRPGETIAVMRPSGPIILRP